MRYAAGSVQSTYSSLVGVAIGGKYEIRRVIGAGGMGVVCEATHVEIGKRVAIKLIDKTMKESELIVARFKREARAAGRIDSEHIVDVFDVGADARVGLYMVMEYLTGEDLQSRLERETKIDVKLGVMIMHQTARALAKAHAAGVIHRDLKPANVFLTERDNGQLLVKLLDFGVSKLIGEAAGSARITGIGTPIGTPLYMAPEQAEGKEDVDGRADVWSLGAMMYESLSGELPFPDLGSYQGTLMGILTSRARPLHDVAAWIPEPLATVIDEMLVHNRHARIPDALTVAQRLITAFPQVLPDGTGKHTAVIVAKTAGAVDATGDTEIFSSTEIPPSVRPRASESAETLADATGSSTPVELPSDHMPTLHNAERITPAAPVSDASLTGGGKKTEPLAPSVRTLPPLSSARISDVLSSPTVGSSGSYAPRSTPSTLASTPPSLEPVRTSAAPPAEKPRHPLRHTVVLLVIAAVAAVAFYAGRRGTARPPEPAAVAPPAITASTPPPPAETAPPPPAPSAVAPSVESAAPAVSASAPASSARPAAPKRRKRPPPASATSAAAPATAPVEPDPAPPSGPPFD